MTPKQKSGTSAKLLLIFLLGMLLCAEGYFGFRLHTLSNQQKEIKHDYTKIGSIKYGMFSVDQWDEYITHIVTLQINQFEMTPGQKKDLQTEVETLLITLVNKAEELIDKRQKSVGGKIRKTAIKTFVNLDKIKDKIPDYAKTIIAKIDNPENKKKLATIALQKFDELKKKPSIDSALAVRDSITSRMFAKYHVSSRHEFDNKISADLSSINKVTYHYAFAMLGCVVTVLLFWWILRKRVELHAILFIMSLLFAFILLWVGLTASMIEVDARIQSFDFVFLGEHIVFENQVLFFQSKSILDVVEVLLKQPRIDSKFVGVLILVFSIVFPVLKLVSTGIHLLSKEKLAQNKIIRYFAFQSGKWSMADVFVIAILMTYIGLNGLLEGRLGDMRIDSNSLSMISTHNTALQPGYIIFIFFVLYGLILSTILKFITPHDAH